MDIMPDMFDSEELNPELQEYLDCEAGFTCIRHPLVYSIMHVPPLNKLMNQSLGHKKQMLSEALEKGDWSRVVFLHERPYRVNYPAKGREASSFNGANLYTWPLRSRLKS